MATLHDVAASITNKEPTAPPSWVNARLGTLNESIVVHSGGGLLHGAWHSQDSDEMLLVLGGSCTVEHQNGSLTAGPGQLIRIEANEPHRVSTTAGTALVAIESSNATRSPLGGAEE